MLPATASAAPGALVAQQQGPGGEATVRKGRPAGGLLALQQPVAVTAGCIGSDGAADSAASAAAPACTATTANRAPAATAAATLAHQQQPSQQQRKGLSHAPVQALARPAFTSAVGVVTATCSSTSPAVVVPEHFSRQLQQQETLPVLEQQQQYGQASCVAQVCSQPAAVAVAGVDASNSGLRQFKTLDQLLPRIRTIRMGVA